MLVKIQTKDLPVDKPRWNPRTGVPKCPQDVWPHLATSDILKLLLLENIKKWKVVKYSYL